MAVEVFGKQFFAESHRLFLRHGFKTCRFPHRLWCFHNEGGGIAIVLIGVRLKPAVLCFLQGEGEGVKQLARAQPHKTTFAFINVGLVGRCKARTHFGVDAITGNDQIGFVLRTDVGIGIDFGFKHQFNTDFFTALLQNIEQTFASYAAKTMAPRAHGFALEMHGNVVPMVERAQNFRSGDGVCHLQPQHRGIRENNAPAKSVIGLIALQHHDVVFWVTQLHEQTKIQASGPAA